MVVLLINQQFGKNKEGFADKTDKKNVKWRKMFYVSEEAVDEKAKNNSLYMFQSSGAHVILLYTFFTY